MMFDAMRFPLILLKIFIGEIKLMTYRIHHENCDFVEAK